MFTLSTPLNTHHHPGSRGFACFNTPCLSSVARGNQAMSWLPSVIQSCLSASPAPSVMLLIALFFYCPLTQSCFKGLGGFDGFSTAAVTFEDSSVSAVYLDVSVWEPCHWLHTREASHWSAQRCICVLLFSTAGEFNHTTICHLTCYGCVRGNSLNSGPHNKL